MLVEQLGQRQETPGGPPAVSDKAHRLSAIAAHPGTSPEVASRIRSSVRRVERRRRLAALASHPNTNFEVSRRIKLALHNQGGKRTPTA
jgi:hypothetical protein